MMHFLSHPESNMRIRTFLPLSKSLAWNEHARADKSVPISSTYKFQTVGLVDIEESLTRAAAQRWVRGERAGRWKYQRHSKWKDMKWSVSQSIDQLIEFAEYLLAHMDERFCAIEQCFFSRRANGFHPLPWCR